MQVSVWPRTGSRHKKREPLKATLRFLKKRNTRPAGFVTRQDRAGAEMYRHIASYFMQIDFPVKRQNQILVFPKIAFSKAFTAEPTVPNVGQNQIAEKSFGEAVLR